MGDLHWFLCIPKTSKIGLRIDLLCFDAFPLAWSVIERCAFEMAGVSRGGFSRSQVFVDAAFRCASDSPNIMP